MLSRANWMWIVDDVPTPPPLSSVPFTVSATRPAPAFDSATADQMLGSGW